MKISDRRHTCSAFISPSIIWYVCLGLTYTSLPVSVFQPVLRVSCYQFLVKLWFLLVEPKRYNLFGYLNMRSFFNYVLLHYNCSNCSQNFSNSNSSSCTYLGRWLNFFKSEGLGGCFLPFPSFPSPVLPCLSVTQNIGNSYINV